MYNTGELQGFTPSMLQADYTNYTGMIAFIIISVIALISIGLAGWATIEYFMKRKNRFNNSYISK